MAKSCCCILWTHHLHPFVSAPENVTCIGPEHPRHRNLRVPGSVRFGACGVSSRGWLRRQKGRDLFLFSRLRRVWVVELCETAVQGWRTFQQRLPPSLRPSQSPWWWRDWTRPGQSDMAWLLEGRRGAAS